MIHMMMTRVIVKQMIINIFFYMGENQISKKKMKKRNKNKKIIRISIRTVTEWKSLKRRSELMYVMMKHQSNARKMIKANRFRFQFLRWMEKVDRFPTKSIIKESTSKRHYSSSLWEKQMSCSLWFLCECVYYVENKSRKNAKNHPEERKNHSTGRC